MSSRAYEVDHEMQLRDLLTKAGLDCLRPPPPSTVSAESEEVESEEVVDAQEEEIKVQESSERNFETTEEMPEVVVDPANAETFEENFQTASLRRLIPEKQRRIEEMNRIKVLPEILISDFAPEAIPVIEQTPLAEVIDILGEMTGCNSYKTNLAEYWFLDTLANLLRRAQKDQMAISMNRIDWHVM